MNIALIAHPSHTGRSMRSFIPFRKGDGYRLGFFFPRLRHGYGAYLKLMDADDTFGYENDADAKELLLDWKPDFLLFNEPHDFGIDAPGGFIFHGLPWRSAETSLVGRIKRWKPFCGTTFVHNERFAEKVRTEAQIAAENVHAVGLVQNDYLLRLNREAMRSALRAQLRAPADAQIILYPESFNARFSTKQEHATLLEWLEAYLAATPQALLIVKSKTAQLQRLKHRSRIVWAHKSLQASDWFGADVMVSLPVGTCIPDALICGLPVVMAAPEEVHDEVWAVENEVGALARNRDELSAALHGIETNEERRKLYLNRMYGDTLDGQVWRRILDEALK